MGWTKEAVKVPRQKTYRISVYGEVLIRKGYHVKPHWRGGTYVRGYNRRSKFEQRRWDLRGTKSELRKAVAKIKANRWAPKVEHKSLRARDLSDEYIDKRKLRLERIAS